MEEIYMKGYIGRRDWCSEKVNFKTYFRKYANSLSLVSRRRISEIEILQHYVPQSNQLSEEELLELVNVTNGAQLTTLFETDFNKESEANKKKKVRGQPSTSKSPENLDDFNILKTFTGDVNKPTNRLKNDNNRNVRKEIRLDAAEKGGIKDIIPKKHFVISFRIHEPYTHVIGDNTKPGRCLQEVIVMGHQALSELKDKIICEMDYQDTRGDISERPDSPVREKAKDVYTSSMFYFDNTFYIDKRNSRNIDYSKPIKKWGMNREMKLGETLGMEQTRVEDLQIRFGYPYLYMHQGSCEHIIIISDARLVKATDSLYSLDYPLMNRIAYQKLINCMTCARFPARWIVRDSDRMMHDPTYQCEACFKLMHYVNGKKVGTFKAWQYWQRGTLL